MNSLPTTRRAAPRPPRPATRPTPKPRVRVLLVLSADGYCELYGPPEVTAHVALRLATDGGNEAEATADEFLTVTLPRAYREIYFPRNLRAAGLCERRTAADEVDRRAALAIVQDLRELRESMQ